MRPESHIWNIVTYLGKLLAWAHTFLNKNKNQHIQADKHTRQTDRLTGRQTDRQICIIKTRNLHKQGHMLEQTCLYQCIGNYIHPWMNASIKPKITGTIYPCITKRENITEYMHSWIHTCAHKYIAHSDNYPTSHETIETWTHKYMHT
jgi:hypothetical protein